MEAEERTEAFCWRTPRFHHIFGVRETSEPKQTNYFGGMKAPDCHHALNAIEVEASTLLVSEQTTAGAPLSHLFGENFSGIARVASAVSAECTAAASMEKDLLHKYKALYGRDKSKLSSQHQVIARLVTELCGPEGRLTRLVEGDEATGFVLLPCSWCEGGDSSREANTFVKKFPDAWMLVARASSGIISVAVASFSPFHPRDRESVPQRVSPLIAVKNVDATKIKDPAFWCVVFNQRFSESQDVKGYKFIHEALLPELLGGRAVDDTLRGAVGSVVEFLASPTAAYVAPAVVPDPLSRHEANKILIEAAVEFLLQHQGVTARQYACLRVGLELVELRNAMSELPSADAASGSWDTDLVRGDMLMLQHACASVARRALAIEEPDQMISRLFAELEEMRHRINEVAVSGSGCLELPRLDMEPVAPFQRISSLDLLAQTFNTTVEEVAGAAAESTEPKQLFVDYGNLPNTLVKTFLEAEAELRRCEELCSKLFSRSTASSFFQICTLVEHFLTVVIPMPHSKNCVWGTTTTTLSGSTQQRVEQSVQLRCLKTLHHLAASYFAASLRMGILEATQAKIEDQGKQESASVIGRRHVIMASLMALTDAVIRIKASDGVLLTTALMTGNPLPEVPPWPAGKPAQTVHPLDDLAAEIAPVSGVQQDATQQAGGEPEETPRGYRVALTSFRGDSLAFVMENSYIDSPELTRVRAEVLEYFGDASTYHMAFLPGEDGSDSASDLIRSPYHRRPQLVEGAPLQNGTGPEELMLFDWYSLSTRMSLGIRLRENQKFAHATLRDSKLAKGWLPQECDSTIGFVHSMLHALNCPFGAEPEANKHNWTTQQDYERERYKKNRTKVEPLDWILDWFADGFQNHAPEFRILRDTVLLYKMSLVPASLLYQLNFELFCKQDVVKPELFLNWECFISANEDYEPENEVKNRQWGFEVAADRTHLGDCETFKISPGDSAKKRAEGAVQPSHVKRLLRDFVKPKYPSHATDAPKPNTESEEKPVPWTVEDYSEDDVLFTLGREKLWKSFVKEFLTLPTAERLLCLVTAPQIAIPLVLDFFADRVGLLMEQDMREFLGAVVFEPREFVFAEQHPQTVPAPRHYGHASGLGTRRGVLFEELQKSPHAVLTALVHLLEQAQRFEPSPSEQASVGLFIFLATLACKIERFATVAMHDTPEALSSDLTAIVKLRKLLSGKWFQTASKLLTACEGETLELRIQVQCCMVELCAFRVAEFQRRKASPLPHDDGSDQLVLLDDMSQLMRSVAFVIARHEKMTEARPELMDCVFDAQSCLERGREGLLLVNRRDPTALQRIIQGMVSAAMPSGSSSSDLETTSQKWLPEKSVPRCERIVESEHPLPPFTDTYDHVSFPGAPFIEISFDELCSLAHNKNETDLPKVILYKDSSCTEKWDECPRGQGASVNWPGAFGSKPLIIPADSFVVHCHSSATWEPNRRLNFGFRMIATAPLSSAGLTDLMNTNSGWLTLSNGRQERIQLELAQLALARANNDVEAARQNLSNRMRQYKQLLAAQTSGEMQWFFKNSTGTMTVSLQSGEVCRNGHVIAPVPQNIRNLPAYKEAFGELASDCTVQENAIHRHWYQLFHNKHVYQIKAWKPEPGLHPKHPLILKQPFRCGGADLLDAHFLPKQNGDTGMLEWLGFAYTHEERPHKRDSSGNETREDGGLLSPQDRTWAMLEECVLAEVDLAERRASTFRASLFFRRKCPVDEAEAIDASPPGDFIFYIGDQYNWPNHTGEFFEVFAVPGRSVINVYRLCEHARRVYRKQVFSSDPSFGMRATLSWNDTFTDANCPPWREAQRGRVFHNLLLPPYKRKRMTVEIVRNRIPDAADRWYADIFGTKKANWGKTKSGFDGIAVDENTEALVPRVLLTGLLPSGLIAHNGDPYTFWRVSEFCIVGTHEKEDELNRFTTLFIQLVPPSSCLTAPLNSPAVSGWSATVIRVAHDNPITAQERETPSEQLVLLNLLEAPPGTILFRLATVFARLDELSHVVAWTKSLPIEAGQVCEISLVECLRLRLSFRVSSSPTSSRQGQGSESGDPEHGMETTTLLECVQHPGWFLSDNPRRETRQLAQGIPHCVVLENLHGQQALLIPNYPFAVRRIKSRPFNTELIRDFHNRFWVTRIKDPLLKKLQKKHQQEVENCQDYARADLYPVLPCAVLSAPTLSARLYLLYMRVLNRDIVAALDIVPQCFADSKLDASALYVYQLLNSLLGTHGVMAATVLLHISKLHVDAPSVDLPWNDVICHLLWVYRVYGYQMPAIAFLDVDTQIRIVEAAALIRAGDDLEERNKAPPSWSYLPALRIPRMPGYRPGEIDDNTGTERFSEFAWLSNSTYLSFAHTLAFLERERAAIRGTSLSSSEKLDTSAAPLRLQQTSELWAAQVAVIPSQLQWVRAGLSFTVGPVQRLKVTQVKPIEADGEEEKDGEESIKTSRSVDVAWDHLQGAVFYRLECKQAKETKEVQISKTCMETNSTVSLMVGHEYQFRVFALSSLGVVGCSGWVAESLEPLPAVDREWAAQWNNVTRMEARSAWQSQQQAQPVARFAWRRPGGVDEEDAADSKPLRVAGPSAVMQLCNAIQGQFVSGSLCPIEERSFPLLYEALLGFIHLDLMGEGQAAKHHGQQKTHGYAPIAAEDEWPDPPKGFRWCGHCNSKVSKPAAKIPLGARVCPSCESYVIDFTEKELQAWDSGAEYPVEEHPLREISPQPADRSTLLVVRLLLTQVFQKQDTSLFQVYRCTQCDGDHVFVGSVLIVLLAAAETNKLQELFPNMPLPPQSELRHFSRLSSAPLGLSAKLGVGRKFCRRVADLCAAAVETNAGSWWTNWVQSQQAMAPPRTELSPVPLPEHKVNHAHPGLMVFSNSSRSQIRVLEPSVLEGLPARRSVSAQIFLASHDMAAFREKHKLLHKFQSPRLFEDSEVVGRLAQSKYNVFRLDALKVHSIAKSSETVVTIERDLEASAKLAPETVWEWASLSDALFDGIQSEAPGWEQQLGVAVSRAENLLRALRDVINKEQLAITEATAAVVAWVNDFGDTDGSAARLGLELLAGVKEHIGFMQVARSLLSTHPGDLKSFNPTLTDTEVAGVHSAVASVMLRSIRLTQVINCANRAAKVVKELQSLQAFLSRSERIPAKERQGRCLAMKLLASDLAASLCVSHSTAYVKDEQHGLLLDPQLLAFEFVSGMTLRCSDSNSQKQHIDDFMRAHEQGQSVVRQMLMGAGKTAVISPALALKLSESAGSDEQSDHDGVERPLVVQVVPTPLLTMSCGVMRNIFTGPLTRRVFTFKFDRTHTLSMSWHEVERLYQQLCCARSEGAIICTTPGDVKSMFLAIVDLLLAIKEATPVLALPRRCIPCSRSMEMVNELAEIVMELEFKAGVFQRIMTLFRARATALIDEVDWVLHPLKSELNFPTGKRVELPMGEARWLLAAHVLDCLFEANAVQGAHADIRLGDKALGAREIIVQRLAQGVEQKVVQQMPHLVLMDERFYKMFLMDVVALWTVAWLVSYKRAGEAKSVLPSQYEDFYVKYIQALPCAHLAPSRLKTFGWQLLNLARKWVTVLLPHCAGKRNRLEYGLLNDDDVEQMVAKHLIADEHAIPEARWEMAVPFVGKDVPSPTSSFASPDVTIGFTILAYRHSQLRLRDTVKIIDYAVTQMNKEHAFGPVEQRPHRNLFMTWVNTAGAAGEVRPLEFLFGSEQKKEAHEALKTNAEMMLFYLERLVFGKHLRFQTTKIQASGVDLGSDMIFHRCLGFSGTPSDILPDTFLKGPDYKVKGCEFEEGSRAKIINILSSETYMEVKEMEQWGVDELLQYVARDKRFHALIDTGALVIGNTNLDVAKKLLKVGKLFKAAVYLDGNDRKMALLRSGWQSVPLEGCGVPPQDRITFFDQAHTTGMDIPQPADAVAAVTLGKGMTLRDHAQGCWRMRGLETGQKCVLIVVPEIKRLILGAMRPEADTRRGPTGRRGSIAVPLMSRGASTTKLLSEKSAAAPPKPVSPAEVVTWLLLNELKSEQGQLHQNAVQLAGLRSRRDAIRTLLATQTPSRVTEVFGKRLIQLRQEKADRAANKRAWKTKQRPEEMEVHLPWEPSFLTRFADAKVLDAVTPHSSSIAHELSFLRSILPRLRGPPTENKEDEGSGSDEDSDGLGSDGKLSCDSDEYDADRVQWAEQQRTRWWHSQQPPRTWEEARQRLCGGLVHIRTHAISKGNVPLKSLSRRVAKVWDFHCGAEPPRWQTKRGGSQRVAGDNPPPRKQDLSRAVRNIERVYRKVGDQAQWFMELGSGKQLKGSIFDLGVKDVEWLGEEETKACEEAIDKKIEESNEKSNWHGVGIAQHVSGCIIVTEVGPLASTHNVRCGDVVLKLNGRLVQTGKVSQKMKASTRDAIELTLQRQGIAAPFDVRIVRPQEAVTGEVQKLGEEMGCFSPVGEQVEEAESVFKETAEWAQYRANLLNTICSLANGSCVGVLATLLPVLRLPVFRSELAGTGARAMMLSQFAATVSEPPSAPPSAAPPSVANSPSLFSPSPQRSQSRLSPRRSLSSVGLPDDIVSDIGPVLDAIEYIPLSHRDVAIEALQNLLKESANVLPTAKLECSHRLAGGQCTFHAVQCPNSTFRVTNVLWAVMEVLRVGPQPETTQLVAKTAGAVRTICDLADPEYPDDVDRALATCCLKLMSLYAQRALVSALDAQPASTPTKQLRNTQLKPLAQPRGGEAISPVAMVTSTPEVDPQVVRLHAALRVFVETLDVDISRENFAHTVSTAAQSLVLTVRQGDEEDDGLDSEMVQEQEQEQTSVAEIIEENPNIWLKPPSAEDHRYPLSNVLIVNEIPVFSLAELKLPVVSGEPGGAGDNPLRQLRFPQHMLVSKLFATQVSGSTRLKPRLKNLQVLFFVSGQQAAQQSAAPQVFVQRGESSSEGWQVSKKAGPQMFCVMLSLAEAETIRRALQCNWDDLANRLPWHCGLCTITGLWLTRRWPPKPSDQEVESLMHVEELRLAPDSSTMSEKSEEARERFRKMDLEDRSFFLISRLVGRLFDGDIYFKPREQIVLLRLLCHHGTPGSNLEQYLSAGLDCRLREVKSLAGTAVQAMTTYKDEQHLAVIDETVGTLHGHMFKSKNQLVDVFAEMDEDESNRLELDELVAFCERMLDQESFARVKPHLPEVFAHADTDHNGFLDLQEFVALFNKNEQSNAADESDANDGAGQATELQSPEESILEQQWLSQKIDPKTQATDKEKSWSAPAHKRCHQVSQVGQLYTSCGGRAKISGSCHNRVSTRPGSFVSALPHGVLLAQEQCFFYEVTLLQCCPTAQVCIGWCTPNFKSDSAARIGVGSEGHSWGLGGSIVRPDTLSRCDSGSRRHPWGARSQSWETGGVIGCLLDLPSRQLYFQYNNGPLCLAFTDIPVDDGIMPAVSLDYGIEVEINFGLKPFRHLLRDDSVRTVQDAIWDAKENMHSQENPSKESFWVTQKMREFVPVDEGETVSGMSWLSSMVYARGILLTRGKWYFEVELQAPSSSSMNAGIRLGFYHPQKFNDVWDLVYDSYTRRIGLFETRISVLMETGQGSTNADEAAIALKPGQTIGCAIDMDARTMDVIVGGEILHSLRVSEFVVPNGFVPVIGTDVDITIRSRPVEGEAALHSGFATAFEQNYKPLSEYQPGQTEGSALTHVGLRVLNGDDFLTKSELEHGWRVTCRSSVASVAVNMPLLTSGFWVYVVKLTTFREPRLTDPMDEEQESGKNKQKQPDDAQLECTGVGSIGWAESKKFNEYEGIGDNGHSWGWMGRRKKGKSTLRHQNRRRPWPDRRENLFQGPPLYQEGDEVCLGHHWQEGDEIACFGHLSGGDNPLLCVWYALKREGSSTQSDVIPAFMAQRVDGGVVPAISLHGGMTVEITLGGRSTDLIWRGFGATLTPPRPDWVVMAQSERRRVAPHAPQQSDKPVSRQITIHRFKGPGAFKDAVAKLESANEDDQHDYGFSHAEITADNFTAPEGGKQKDSPASRLLLGLVERKVAHIRLNAVSLPSDSRWWRVLKTLLRSEGLETLDLSNSPDLAEKQVLGRLYQAVLKAAKRGMRRHNKLPARHVAMQPAFALPLARLYLPRCNLTADDMQSLAACLHELPNLLELDVSGNPIGSEGAETLGFGIQPLRALRVLKAASNNAGGLGVEGLLKVVSARHRIEHLDLGDNNMGVHGATVVSALLRGGTPVQVLNLAGNMLGDVGLGIIRETVVDKKVVRLLQVLDLSENGITKDGATDLAHVITQTSLRELLCQWNNVGDEGAQQLIDMLRQSSPARFESISFKDSSVSVPQQVRIIFAMQHFPRLARLTMGQVLQLGNHTETRQFFQRPMYVACRRECRLLAEVFVAMRNTNGREGAAEMDVMTGAKLGRHPEVPDDILDALHLLVDEPDILPGLLQLIFGSNGELGVEVENVDYPAAYMMEENGRVTAVNKRVTVQECHDVWGCKYRHPLPASGPVKLEVDSDAPAQAPTAKDTSAERTLLLRAMGKKRWDIAQLLVLRNRAVRCELKDEGGRMFERLWIEESAGARERVVTKPTVTEQTRAAGDSGSTTRWVMRTIWSDLCGALTPDIVVQTPSRNDVGPQPNAELTPIRLAARDGQGVLVALLCDLGYEIQQLLGCDHLELDGVAQSRRGDDEDTRMDLMLQDTSLPLHDVAMSSPDAFAKSDELVQFAERLLRVRDGEYAYRTDAQGRTPLHIGAANGHVELVAMFEAHGIGLLQPAKHLHWTCCEWLPDSLSLPDACLPDNADDYNAGIHYIDLLDTMGRSALATAVEAGQVRCVQKLLELKAFTGLSQGENQHAAEPVVSLLKAAGAGWTRRLGLTKHGRDDNAPLDAFETCLLRFAAEVERHSDNDPMPDDEPQSIESRTGFTWRPSRGSAEWTRPQIAVSTGLKRASTDPNKRLTVAQHQMHAINAEVMNRRRNFVWRHLTTHALPSVVFIILLTVYAIASVTGAAGSGAVVRAFGSSWSDAMVGANFPNAEGQFPAISSMDDAWDFLETALPDVLWPEDWDGTGLVDASTRVVGAVRIRQQRGSAQDCGAPSGFGVPPAATCYGGVDSTGNHVDNADMPEHTWTDGGGTRGLLSVLNNGDDGSGFVVDLSPLNRSVAMATLTALRAGGWTDAATRWLHVEYTLLNHNIDRMSVGHLSVETPEGGGAWPLSEYATLQFTSLTDEFTLDLSDRGLFMWLQLLVLLFVSVSVLGEFREFKQSPIMYLNDVGNTIDALTFLLTIVVIVLRFAVFSSMSDLPTLDITDESFLDMQPVVFLSNAQLKILAITIVVAWSRLIKYLRLIPTLGPMMQATTATMMSMRVLAFVAFFAAFVIVLGISCYVAFGGDPSVEAFASFPTSVLTVFTFCFGEIADTLESTRTHAPIFSPLIFLIMAMVGTLTMMNVFIAVINVLYDDAEKQAVAKWQTTIDLLMAKDLIDARHPDRFRGMFQRGIAKDVVEAGLRTAEEERRHEDLRLWESHRHALEERVDTLHRGLTQVKGAKGQEGGDAVEDDGRSSLARLPTGGPERVPPRVVSREVEALRGEVMGRIDQLDAKLNRLLDLMQPKDLTDSPSMP